MANPEKSTEKDRKVSRKSNHDRSSSHRHKKRRDKYDKVSEKYDLSKGHETASSSSYDSSSSSYSSSSYLDSESDFSANSNSVERSKKKPHRRRKGSKKERSRHRSAKKRRKSSKDGIGNKKVKEKDSSKRSKKQEKYNYHSKRRRSKQHHYNSDTEKLIPSQSHELLKALLEILQSYPDMSSQILIMLRQMSGSGTSFDLGQMPDQHLAHALRNVFMVLSSYGVQQQQSQGSHSNSSIWLWKLNSGSSSANSMGGIRKQWDEFLLLKIMRSLLDQAGMSMEAVLDFEKAEALSMEKRMHRKDEECLNEVNKENTLQIQKDHMTPENTASSPPSLISELQNFTLSLLSNFSVASLPNSEKTSLSHELSQLCQLLLDGETLSLDNIPNLELRMGLQILFSRTGLDYYEMDSEDEEDERGESKNNDNTNKDNLNGAEEIGDGASENKHDPCMGFGLPDSNDEDNNKVIEKVKQHLLSVIESCNSFAISPRQEVHEERFEVKSTKRITKGPSLPAFMNASNAATIPNHSSSESSDDDGPAPAGSLGANRRRQIGPKISNQVVKTMVVQRASDLMQAKGNNAESTNSMENNGSSREEWMMNPGEHDFLKGIIRSGDVLKTRKFKNEKQRGGSDSTNNDQPPVISARLQKQMDDVIKAHTEARGPSLIEQHRQKKAEEKKAAALNSGGNEWNWSKSDLDAGRRVDKKALGQILGGAAKGLTDKFQGGVSRGFM